MLVCHPQGLFFKSYGPIPERLLRLKLYKAQKVRFVPLKTPICVTPYINGVSFVLYDNDELKKKIKNRIRSLKN